MLYDPSNKKTARPVVSATANRLSTLVRSFSSSSSPGLLSPACGEGLIDANTKSNERSRSGHDAISSGSLDTFILDRDWVPVNANRSVALKID